VTEKRKNAVQRREILAAIQEFSYDKGLFLWLGRRHKPNIISPTELRYPDTMNELDLVLLSKEPEGPFTEVFFIEAIVDDLSTRNPAELTVELREYLMEMGLITD